MPADTRIAPTPSHHLRKTLLRILRLIPHAAVVPLLRARLFNREFYLSSNPDVAGGKLNPFWHFMIFGAFEGRKAHPFFDAAYYLRQNPEIAAAGINPLIHYLKRGSAEGRKPHPLFPENEAAGGENPLLRYAKSTTSPEATLYSWWLRIEGQQSLPNLARSPRFSILMETSDPRLRQLREAVASVQAQAYACWELCICVNGASDPGLPEYLDSVVRPETHIRVVRLPHRVDAALALNRAAALTTGEYLAVLDQQDCLAPAALHWLATGAPADLIYSDEDHLDPAGARVDPIFKPDWSPDLLLSGMYIGRIMAVSRTAWERSGGFRPGFGSMRDYDLAVRVTDGPAAVRHIPRVLYHSRSATVSAERIAGVAGRQCLADAVQRRGLAAEVETGSSPAPFRLRWQSNRTKLVSVIMCSRSPDLLERCLTALEERTTYPRREIVVVQHLQGETSALQAVIDRHSAKRMTYSGAFDFSRMNNLGAQMARGEILLFLNDDTEPLEPTWLDRLVAQVERDDIGIAGARLLYPSGTLQHAAVAVGIAGGCGHIGRNMRHAPPQWPWLEMSRDVSAVTGACLAIRAPLFHELSGFSEAFPVNYNDIDLCLRAREAGYRVIYEAAAVLRHYECQSRRHGVVTPEERARWHSRWAEIIEAGDPFYNPNLTPGHEDLSLGSPAHQTAFISPTP